MLLLCHIIGHPNSCFSPCTLLSPASTVSYRNGQQKHLWHTVCHFLEADGDGDWPGLIPADGVLGGRCH